MEIKFSALMSVRGANAIVDLSQVPFITSLGIGMLITASKSVKRGGGKFVVLGTQSAVFLVIETSGLCDLLGVVADEGDAQQLLAPPSA